MSENQMKSYDCDIQREGKKITLPAQPRPMAIDTAIQVLERKREQEELIVRISEQINCLPWEGAFAMREAMREIYGWSEGKTLKGGFFEPDRAPTMIAVPTAFGVTQQVMWGAFAIQGFDSNEYIETEINSAGDYPVLVITGEVKQKHKGEVEALANRTREIVMKRSIYKNKAITIPTDTNGNIDMTQPLKYLDTSKTKPEELIFSDDLQRDLNANVLTPICATDACRKAGVPLKRGVLLAGPYGVGKTMTAAVIAKLCEMNGWTFIHLDNVDALNEALHVADRFQPAIVFAEDCDQSIGTQQRTAKVNKVLNTIDGVIAKDSEVITILTSNHVEQINRAMLRPGRLDVVLTITAPDSKAANRLMRQYGRELIHEDEDLTLASEALDGKIPAVIREVVERAKLYAIARDPFSEYKLTGNDLLESAQSMTRHLELLDGPSDKPETSAETLRRGLSNIVQEATDTVVLSDVKDGIQEILSNF